MAIDSSENGNIFVKNGELVSNNGKDYIEAVVYWAEAHYLAYKTYCSDSRFWQGVDNNAYSLKHLCERDINMYVSAYSMANVYAYLGYQIKNKNNIFTIYRRRNSFFRKVRQLDLTCKELFQIKERTFTNKGIDYNDWMGFKEG